MSIQESVQMITLKTIIFDCGRVLTCDQNPGHARAMAESLGVPLREFLAVYASERHEYDRGTETARHYWDRVAGNWSRKLDDADLEKMIGHDLDSWFTINTETVALVGELKSEGYRLLILSNMNFEGKERLLGPARLLDGKDWLSLFDEVLFSCDLKLLKPEREIYERCLEKTFAPARACLFIDDIQVNVQAARNSGMNAILFTDTFSLREILERDYSIRLNPVAPRS